MTSLTNFYVKLQSIFKQKASKDLAIMKEFVEKIDLKKKINAELLSTFCENCLTLEFIHFSDIKEEITTTKSIDFCQTFKSLCVSMILMYINCFLVYLFTFSLFPCFLSFTPYNYVVDGE